MTWHKEIKVAIFDLDGTLYQDYTFLGRYVSHMLGSRLQGQELQAAIDEAYMILEGRHPVKFGYLSCHDGKRAYSHEGLIPTGCFGWDGKEAVLNQEEMEMGGLFYIGDPWGIAAILAKRHGVHAEEQLKAFETVRKEMLAGPHQIEVFPGLLEAVGKMDAERKIFMTNTPSPSAEEFVSFLGLENLFDTYIVDAQKPEGIRGVMKRLGEEGYQPHEIISVGDNPFNDLYPVKQLGGRTCLISRYEHAGSEEWDHSVKTIEELAGFLKLLEAVPSGAL
jgi:FMN phosphatase YigB (HAD superfamily)